MASFIYCHAQEVLVIDHPEKEFFLSDKNFKIIKDRSDALSIIEISHDSLKGAFDKSKLNPKSSNEPSVYWYRFSVENRLGNSYQLSFELLNTRVDRFEFYIPDTSGKFLEFKGGDKFPFSSKSIKHKNFLFLLPKTDSGTVTTYFLKVKLDNHLVNKERAVVRTHQKFIAYALSEYYFLGIFYGVILIMLVYNVILFFTIKSSSYFYYTLYIISIGLYSLSWNGLGFQYFWPDYPIINDYALPTASFLIVVLASLYARSFLFTSVRAKLIDRIIIAAVILRSALFILGIFFFKDILLFYQLDILPLLVGFIAGVIALYRKFLPARFYIAGYSFLFLGFLILSLVHNGIIKPNIFTVYSLEMGVVIELIFFSIALAEKYKTLRSSREKALRMAVEQLKENEKLKDKVNAELEAKVQERTIELQQANEKLKVQAEEINKMNLLLDSDNRKLQQNVNELTSARVFIKNVDIEEFNKLYATDDSCYKYLSLLKWDEGYKCRKCEGAKFSWGKTPYGRRCTKCGYEESVTAHTIFHNMKIPVLKAFQIVFLVYSSNEKVSSTELSKLLSIRQKTCWEYKKLISLRILEKKKLLKTDKLGGWDKLIPD
ncbi:MAG: 7TM diverse intracellular signaling domain-containing protein [Cytophagaceae bacterium]